MKRRPATLLIVLGLGSAALAQTVPTAATENKAPAFNPGSRSVTLNDGHTMPIIGLGVFTLSDADAEAAVLAALKDGYRLIDTAHIYGNEEAVGRAIKKSGVPRANIFLTSKLWTDDFANAPAEINAMLKRSTPTTSTSCCCTIPRRTTAMPTRRWKTPSKRAKSAPSASPTTTKKKSPPS